MSQILCAIFFASGAAALIFETLWFRQAGLAFGNSVWASSLVLSSFMAGLALGNGLAARRGPRLTRPLRAYAALEIAIAVSGLALVHGLPQLPAVLTPALRPFLDVPWILNPLRLACAFALLLVPATAMGATLPLLVGALRGRDPSFASALGRLYGWNTLGAVAGALAGELLLVEALGVRGSARVAAGLDVAAALVALALAARAGPVAAPPAAAAARPARLPPRARRLLAAALLSGGALLALEVVWFRFLLLFVYTGSLTFALMLAVVLAGIALGGLAAGRALHRRPDWLRHTAALAFAAGGTCVLLYAAFSRVIEPYEHGYVFAVRSILALAAFLMLPVSLLSGALFTCTGDALRRLVPHDVRATGLLTLANTIGSGAGSLLAGFVLLPLLGTERSFFALAFAYGVVALLLLDAEPEAPRRPSRLRLACGALFVVALLRFPFGLMSERYLTIPVRRIGGGEQIVALREGRSETLLYLRAALDGQTLHHRLVTDGFSMAGNALPARRYMELFVHLPRALRPEPRSALLVSYGLGTTARALTAIPSLEHIDVVDTSSEVLEMSHIAFQSSDRDPLRDPRVRQHVEDGRWFLQATGRRYDLITGEPPPPKAAGVVNLYTREYFALLRERLAEGGLVSYWLPVHNLLVSDTRAIVRAFCDVFPDCTLWSGAGFDWILLGARGEWPPPDAEAFSRAWRDPETAAGLRRIGIERPEQLGAFFLADAADLRELVAGAPPLVDDFPLRLANRVPPVAFARSSHLGWIRPGRARERFETSAWVRRVWPERLRERTLAYFPAQRVIERALRGRSRELVQVLQDVHEVLATTELRTPVLWRLGVDDAELEAVDRLLAHGRPEAPYLPQLARRALAERDFDAAARYFERALALTSARDLFWLRAYALAMADRRDEAAELVRARASNSLEDAEIAAWLRETFDLASG